MARTAGGIPPVLLAPCAEANGSGLTDAVLGLSGRPAEDPRRQLSAIVDGSGDAIFGATTDGMITSWNAAAERLLLGYTANEIIGQSWAVLGPPGRGSEAEDVRARLNADGPAERFETTRRRKDGSLVDVFITASPAIDERRTVVGLSVIARDITERRGTQRALEESQRRVSCHATPPPLLCSVLLTS